MGEYIEAFKSVIPVRMEMYWGTATGVTGTVITYLFGAWNSTLEALIMAMLMDYMTGVFAAYIAPTGKLNSERGFHGILKKIIILTLVSFAHFLDTATGQQVLCTGVAWFFIGNEGLSIVENAAKAGLPVPGKLRDALEQLAHEKWQKEGTKK